MSTPTAILSALQTQLSGNATLSAYVKQFLLGVRESMTMFPVIVIEPVLNDESDEIHNRQECKLSVTVLAYIRVHDESKQIVGDANTKGILDVENDIKKALSSDRTLSGNCKWLSIKPTRYEFVNFPIRNLEMEIEIEFRQTDTGRV